MTGTATIIRTAIIITMLEYDFMRNAFAAAGVAAVVSGLVGYFLVLRGQTFAGHALSHIGFAGATGAVLIGVASVWGLVGFTVAAGIGMGMLGRAPERAAMSPSASCSSLALGLGLLFLHYYTAFATQATALLFGNVLAVDRSMIGNADRAGRDHALRPCGHHAAADFRHPAAGTGRSQRRTAALRLDGFPGHCGAGGVGKRADRRRACWCSR